LIFVVVMLKMGAKEGVGVWLGGGVEDEETDEEEEDEEVGEEKSWVEVVVEGCEMASFWRSASNPKLSPLRSARSAGTIPERP
jgi:hypothetical protein